MKTTVAECAKAIRAELKATYPGVKFSVTSENFSMGNAVRVEYTDAMPAREVEDLLKKYQYGHFDGMTDSYEISNRRADLPQTKFLTVRREKSEEAKAKISEELKKIYPDFEYNEYLPNAGEYGYTLVHREFCKMSF